MSNFVKMKTRLNCDLFEAYRSMTRQDKMEKWGATFSEHQFEIVFHYGKLKAEIYERGDLNESVQAVVWQGEASFFSKENQPIVQPCQLSFYRMNCTQKTEYCAEIHLVIETLGDRLVEESQLVQVGASILDMMRKRYNKDWVILDSDLHASILRGTF